MRIPFGNRRRPILLLGCMAGGLLLIIALTAVVLRLAGGSSVRPHATAPNATGADRSSGPELTGPAPPVVSSSAADVSYWDALPSVIPAVCATYPAVNTDLTSDPTTYAQAFVTTLFTRDYRRSTRDQLIAWVQWEDAPLRSTDYPAADWSKVLIDSLTDLTWDQSTDTPIPADGPWLALAAEGGWQSVSDIAVSVDPTWEQYLNGGGQPPDPMAAGLAVTATITLHTALSGRARTATFAVSLEVQLGSSPRHSGYAMAVTNNYVLKQVN